jgi:hypothetical protein
MSVNVAVSYWTVPEAARLLGELAWRVGRAARKLAAVLPKFGNYRVLDTELLERVRQELAERDERRARRKAVPSA